MRSPRIAIAIVVSFVAIGCTSQPETKLVGKWQSEPNKAGVAVQFEFLRDGSVIKNQKSRTAEWKQIGTGTFKFIDKTHLKVELQPSWYFGVVIYEVVWPDKDHLELQAGDETILLSRQG